LSANNTGIHAYKYHDQILHKVAYFDTLVNTRKMIQGPDSTIFIAQGTSGITAYEYEGLQFKKIVSLNCGQVNGMTINSQGRLFIANDISGIGIVDYDGTSLKTKNNFTVKNLYDQTVKVNDVALMNDSLFCFVSEEDLFVYSSKDS
jgi:hypothetical protein